jgi:hypothetical protein
VSTPSRPLLIGLLATLSIAGVWFVALKPPGKGADSNSPYNGPISQAQKAVVQSQVAAAKSEQAAGNETTPAATPTPPSALATAKPSVPIHPAVKHPVATHPAVTHHVAVHSSTPVTHTAPKHPVVVTHHTPKAAQIAPWDQSAKILSAIAHHNVAVVLFWTKGGSDDNSVRRSVQQIGKGKHTAAFVIPMKDVGKYEAITNGMEITVSPTTLIIGPKDQFIPIIGYTTVPTIQQYVNSVR